MNNLTKNVEIGVPGIDAQHKKLVNSLNNAVSMGAKTLSKDVAQKAGKTQKTANN